MILCRQKDTWASALEPDLPGIPPLHQLGTSRLEPCAGFFLISFIASFALFQNLNGVPSFGCPDDFRLKDALIMLSMLPSSPWQLCYGNNS